MVTPGAPQVANIGFNARIGALVASTDARASTASLRRLQTRLGFGELGRAVLELSPFGLTAPAVGDPVEIELDVGEGAERVFTGVVGAVTASSLGLRVIADCPLAALARLQVEEVWEGQTLGDVAQALLERAGIEVGEIETGPTLGRLMLRRGPRAWRHLLDLAELAGLELGCGPDGRASLKAPAPPEARRTLRWGADLLDLQITATALSPDGVEVRGEGAASSAGEERAHWLPVDLSSVSARAAVIEQEGGLSAKAGATAESPRWILNGALRSGEAVKAAADGFASARAARPWVGYALSPGAVDLAPGDGFEVKDLPNDHALSPYVTSPLRARAIQHDLDAATGLRTRLEL